MAENESLRDQLQNLVREGKVERPKRKPRKEFKPRPKKEISFRKENGGLRPGRYKLPDRTVLKVRENGYIWVRHRDKKKQKRLLRQTEENLRRQIIAFNPGQKPEQLLKLNKIQLANILNPRPNFIFAESWLFNSQEYKAKKLRSLIEKAERMIPPRKGRSGKNPAK